MDTIYYSGDFASTNGTSFKKIRFVEKPSIDRLIADERKALTVTLTAQNVEKRPYTCAEFTDPAGFKIYVNVDLLDDIAPDWWQALEEYGEFSEDTWLFTAYNGVVYIRKNGELVGGAMRIEVIIEESEEAVA